MIRFARGIGRRGIFLVLIGAVWVLNGLSVALKPPPIKGFLIIQRVAPLSTWGWTFVLGGVIALFFAFRRKDYPGFIGAVVPCVFWGGAEIASYVEGTYDRGLVASFVWVLVTLIIFLIAGWPEPAPHHENGRPDVRPPRG
jgi:hypothetical protein